MKVDIRIINIPGSGADWRLAGEANESDLPRLDGDQIAISKAYGIPERDYRRSVLARQIAESRYRRYANRFGELLAKAAAPHKVNSADVVYDLWENKFYCYLRSERATVPLAFEATVITVPLERGDEAGLACAEERVRFGVSEAFRAPTRRGNGSSRRRA